MKLIYRIAIRLSALLLPLLALWAMIFYFTMVREINDEADDALEDYSRLLMIKVLGGEPLPESGDGTNNSYSLIAVSEEYAASRPAISYHDEDVYIEEKRETEPARVLVTVFPDREGDWYEMRVSMPTFEKQDLQRTVLTWVVLLYLLLIVITVGTTLWVFKKNLRPLYSLLEWLDGYVPGKKPSPVPNDTDISEFRRLNAAARQAVDRSEELLEQQKEFLGNAAHELQTPLAVLQARLEYMVDNAGLDEEMLAEASKMQGTLSRVIRLNRTLLLLAKIENGQFPENSDVDLAAIVQDLREMYSEIYGGRDISCDLEFSGPLMVRMNETLASVLVSNLLKNAYVHSAPGARIVVAGRGSVLDISNDGKEPLDARRVFERFSHAPGAEGSTGLGLALVRAVAERYGIKVDYSCLEGRHHFRVDFGTVIAV